MKNASAAALAILSGGKYLRAELYDITLSTGAVYRFTSFDTPLTAAIYPSGTQNVYQGGLTITRGATTQATGLDAQELELTISPNFDNPGGPALIAGYSVQKAARLGILDNAKVVFSKLFMNFPATGTQLDTSAGAIAWFAGAVSAIDISRFHVILKSSSNLLVLSNTQMPRNLFQAGCVHTLYDAGCTLSQAGNTYSGSISTVTDSSHVTTNLTQADGFFELGVLTFTSGANNGFSSTVKTFKNASGAVTVCLPFPATIAPGDTFNIYPGCDHLQATCASGKFKIGGVGASNIIHFKGMPYVPATETLYDGGTSNPPQYQQGHVVSSSISGLIVQIP